MDGALRSVLKCSASVIDNIINKLSQVESSLLFDELPIVSEAKKVREVKERQRN